MFRVACQGLKVLHRGRFALNATVCSVLRPTSVIRQQQHPTSSSSSLAVEVSNDLTACSLRQIFPKHDDFADRHIGPNEMEEKAMLDFLGMENMEELVSKSMPDDIRRQEEFKMDEALTERELISRIRHLADKNKVWRSYIGMGYYNCCVPTTILRNIFENPGWTTQYTPYQPEIAQGRLEGLLNYQTMVADMTAMDIANASLLDEATACAEAMGLCYRHNKRSKFYVDSRCHPQNIAVVETRAKGLGIEVVVCDRSEMDTSNRDFTGVLIQYPDTDGTIDDVAQLVSDAKANGSLVCCATDLLALTVIQAPGEFGCDIAVGTSQRFGVPLGFGGPSAGFFAVKDAFKRLMPGRMVGVTRDAKGNMAFRLALQTREQHIRRDKATSNICTAQALLANMSAMYAVYHGPQGLEHLGRRVHHATLLLAKGVEMSGNKVLNSAFFDTIKISPKDGIAMVRKRAEEQQINLRYFQDGTIGVSIDETTEEKDINDLLKIFGCDQTMESIASSMEGGPVPQDSILNSQFQRTSGYLSHAVFHRY